MTEGVRRAASRNVVERSMSRFLREPPSVRTAARVIVVATGVVVVAGGVLMRVFDHDEYPNIWVGMWWALQTVTTVGYGDVTPHHRSGRIIAAFVTIVIAAITSIFVARAAKERGVSEAANEDAAEAGVETRLDALEQRIERLEKPPS
jgi:voltage-gated potassium channel